jgi:pilus assembly protein CpaB
MNLKTWIPLALAIVLGLIAAKVAQDTLSRNRNSGQGQSKQVKIVVANGPIAPGQALTAEMLAMGPISADVPPPGAFTDLAAVVGRTAVSTLFKGQPVMDELLAVRGSGAGLQALVPRGMRAITVEVNETTGLAGMVLPGSRVDVVTTLTGPNRDETLACTIVQDALVQAVGQRLASGRLPDEKDAVPIRTVTLITSPRDAEAIELASNTGRTRLVLRGHNDRGLSDSPGITFVELRGEENTRTVIVPLNPVLPVAATQPVAPPQTRPAAPDPFAEEEPRPRRTVTLIRGGTRSEVVFELPRGAAPSDRAITSTNEGGGQ